METVSLSQFFLLTTWFASAALLYILALIARFYEGVSGETTYYRLYVIPVLTTGFATARYASLDQWGGDWLGDVLLAVGGAVLLWLCYHLYRRMMNGRQ